jgi:hypothetical protein
LVLAKIPVDQGKQRRAHAELRAGGERRLSVVGMHELDRRLCHQFLFRPPECLRPRRIEASEMPVESRDAEVVEGHLEELGVSQAFVVALMIGIDTASNEAGECPAGIFVRFAAIDDVSINPVVAAEPKFRLEAPAPLEVAAVDGEPLGESSRRRARPVKASHLALK